MKIPAYIKNDIEVVHRLAEKIERYNNEIENWYNREMEKFDEDVHESAEYEEMEEIANNERDIKEYYLSHIEHNIKYLEELSKNI